MEEREKESEEEEKDWERRRVLRPLRSRFPGPEGLGSWHWRMVVVEAFILAVADTRVFWA